MKLTRLRNIIVERKPEESVTSWFVVGENEKILDAVWFGDTVSVVLVEYDKGVKK